MNQYRKLNNYWGVTSHIEYFENPSIAIGIPCIPKHVKHLPELMESIKKQTISPTEVILGISETDKQEADKLLKRFSSILLPSKLIVTSTAERAFEGENRNRIADHCTADLISFIDADDLLHHQRNEILLDVYNRYRPRSIVHQWTSNLKYMGEKINNAKVVDGMMLHKLNKNKKTPHLVGAEGLHHAHITVETKLFKKIRQDEGGGIGKDSKFVRRILDTYLNDPKAMYFIKERLTIYRPELSSFR